MPPVIPLTEIPTLPLLYKLKHLHAPAQAALFPASQSLNNKISLLRTDITSLAVDAIVNAANNSLLGGGGVDGAIHCGAGPSLLEECRTLDGCATGSAKITDAYELPCKKVIHAVGPVYYRAKREGKHTQYLRGCYRKSLELAVANGCRSVAFSAISTGVYGYPSGEAAATAIEEVRRFLEKEKGGEELDRVVFCVFEAKDERAYTEWLPKFFPPTEKVPGTHERESGQETDKSESELSAERLPDPPTEEPTDKEGPLAKKAKVDDSLNK
ncbi:MAG: hypothetical protein M1819_003437 [Sarea resinae]|nr:MAG: hypothetical protein M1819_003437 [Sarea resinae]